MKTIKIITLTEQKQPNFDVRIRFKGIRKKARKTEHHSIKAIEGATIDSILDATTQELKPEALQDIKDLAISLLSNNYREYSKQVELVFNYTLSHKESGLICNEWEPFGENNFTLNVEI